MQPRFLHPPTCTGCTLDSIGLGFAPPVGPVDARLIFVGEALGWEEAIHGEPFYGSAGGVLSRLCMRAGIDRRQVRIANVVSCRPPNDYLVGAPWEEHAISQCRQYLQPVLDAVPTDAVVVPLGATALQAVLHLRGVPGVQVKDFHGTVSRSVDNRYWVVPTFHPSHLQRGAMNLLEVVTQDLQLAQKVSLHGFQRSSVNLVVDPHPDWFRAWVRDHLQRVAADPASTHLGLDTEFAEKAGGADESEVVLGDTLSPLTRINGANDGVTGWTVPYRSPYREIVEDLVRGIVEADGWIWLWNKYADLTHLRAAGHTLGNGDRFVDAMWLWHYLQSDLPRGLGFVAPMASDFGPWKHWGKDRSKEGVYAAADGVQQWRTSMWLLEAAIKSQMWDLFLDDWHERDIYVLRPAFDVGTPVDRPALEAFHQELQVKQGEILARIKQTAAQGVLKPKEGYAKKPKGKVVDGVEQPPTPPAAILGKPKKGGGEAKLSYMTEGVRLVEKIVYVEIRICTTCGATDVGPKHKCLLPRAGVRRTARKATARGRGDHVAGGEAPSVGSLDETSTPPVVRPVAALATTVVRRARFFWQLPFNPDAPAQVLAYLDQQGIAAPIDKKKQRKTTAKKELEALQKKHQDDPFFQLQLDWKAVQKVDSTYAVGVLARMDRDDRIHPEFLPKPSTLRDSCVGVNLQNVVADKGGAQGLAAGFRRCIQARDGVPADVTAAELAVWEAKWR